MRDLATLSPSKLDAGQGRPLWRLGALLTFKALGEETGGQFWALETGVPAQALTLPPPPDGPPDVGAIVASLTRYGTETLGPPPGGV